MIIVVDDNWLPIDTAPRDGMTIIVGWDSASVWIVRSARYVRADEWFPQLETDEAGKDGWWSYRNSVGQELLDGYRTPTHWLPMPPPPNGDT